VWRGETVRDLPVVRIPWPRAGARILASEADGVAHHEGVLREEGGDGDGDGDGGGGGCAYRT